MSVALFGLVPCCSEFCLAIASVEVMEELLLKILAAYLEHFGLLFFVWTILT